MPAQRVPNEIHKLRGTYRKDRHGPKQPAKPKAMMATVSTPDVVWVVEGGEHPYHCPRCRSPLDLVLTSDRRWQVECPRCSSGLADTALGFVVAGLARVETGRRPGSRSGPARYHHAPRRTSPGPGKLLRIRC